MAEQDKPFVVNDKRKFRLDGELREPAPTRTESGEDAAASAGNTSTAPESSAKVVNYGARAASIREHETAASHAEHRTSGPVPINSVSTSSAQTNSAHMVTPVPEPDENAAVDADMDADLDDTLPAPPTAEEISQVQTAYTATAERLDTVMRATNPGAEHMPPMDFTRLVQSVYMSAMMQLGAGTPQGEQARVDLLGAKQSIDMLGVIAEKSQKSLDSNEKKLIDSALFELRMGFLEMTQLLARQAATKQGAGAGSPFGGGGAIGGPRIVS